MILAAAGGTVFVPEHAGRCLKPARNCSPELLDESSILPFQIVTAFENVIADGIGLAELIAGHGPGG
jgi:hypothetical protein